MPKARTDIPVSVWCGSTAEVAGQPVALGESSMEARDRRVGACGPGLKPGVISICSCLLPRQPPHLNNPCSLHFKLIDTGSLEPMLDLQPSERSM